MSQVPVRQGWRVVGKPLQLSIPVDLEALYRALLIAEDSAYDSDWPVNVEVRLGRLEDGLLVAVQRERTASLVDCRVLGQNRTAVSLWVRPGPTSEGLRRLLEALVRLVPEAAPLLEAVVGTRKGKRERQGGHNAGGRRGALAGRGRKDFEGMYAKLVEELGGVKKARAPESERLRVRPTLRDMAGEFYVSERTLRRRLGELGLTWSDIEGSWKPPAT